ncbi:hypothetical protein FA95DRAFT_1578145 [Auriscalpium vulgare]|uniref:Uncharacterized protein n=1 Tax=Auriscalpium vulgare TaxID=40419 RepID=A0ACB8R456_9AGAM|nr:hypothetical protein FA95DRAFT_1578145 [Auriscalpium vulgare]
MAPRPKETKEAQRVSPRSSGNAKQPSAPNNPVPNERVGAPADDPPVRDPAPHLADTSRTNATPGPSGVTPSTVHDIDGNGRSALTSLTDIENALDEPGDDGHATSLQDKGKDRAIDDGHGSMGTQIMDPRLITMLDDLQMHVAAHDSQLETAAVVAEQARQSVQAATVARVQINSIISAIMHQYGSPVIKQEEEEIDLSQLPPAAPVSIVVTPPSILDSPGSSSHAGLGTRTPEEGIRNLEKHRARMAEMIQKTTPVGRSDHRIAPKVAGPTERGRVREHAAQFDRKVLKSNDRHIRIAEPYTSVSPYSVVSTKPRVQAMPTQVTPKSGVLGVLDPEERIREMVLSRVSEAVSAGLQIKGLKFSMPESYGGKDDLITFEVWLGALLRWLRLSQAVGPLHDGLRLDVLGQCLTDRAAKWYNDEIESPSRSQTDWTFLDAILALFRRFRSDQTALEHFMATRFSRKGGVADFYNELCARPTRLVEMPNDYTFRKLFVNGLPSDILEIMYKHKGVVAEEGTTTELLAAALEAESGTRAYRQMLDSLTRPHVTSATVLAPSTATTSINSRVAENNARKLRSSSRSPRPNTPKATQLDVDKGDSYRTQGHGATSRTHRDSDKSAPRPRPDRKTVVCFACGGSGHYAGDKECPKTGQPRVYAARMMEETDETHNAVDVPPGDQDAGQSGDPEAENNSLSESDEDSPLGPQYESAEEYAEDYELDDDDAEEDNIGPPMRLATMRIAAMRLRPSSNDDDDSENAGTQNEASSSIPIPTHTNGTSGSHSPVGTTPDDGWPTLGAATAAPTWGDAQPAWGEGPTVEWGNYSPPDTTDQPTSWVTPANEWPTAVSPGQANEPRTIEYLDDHLNAVVSAGPGTPLYKMVARESTSREHDIDEAYQNGINVGIQMAQRSLSSAAGQLGATDAYSSGLEFARRALDVLADRPYQSANRADSLSRRSAVDDDEEDLYADLPALIDMPENEQYVTTAPQDPTLPQEESQPADSLHEPQSELNTEPATRAAATTATLGINEYAADDGDSSEVEDISELQIMATRVQKHDGAKPTPK